MRSSYWRREEWHASLLPSFFRHQTTESCNPLNPDLSSPDHVHTALETCMNSGFTGYGIRNPVTFSSPRNPPHVHPLRFYFLCTHYVLGTPRDIGDYGSDGEESAWNAGDAGSIPGSGRSPGEVNGNPLQYSCLENPMDRGACWAMVHGVTKCWT